MRDSSLPTRRGAAGEAAATASAGAGGGEVGAVAERMEMLRLLGRRVKSFEHLGLLGFFVASAGVLFFFFFLLVFFLSFSYRPSWPSLPPAAAGGTPRFDWGLAENADGGGRAERHSSGSAGIGGKGGAGAGGEDCDWFEGQWVWDEKYPLYESEDCSFLDEGFRCSENGRPDRFYTKWRWQPAGCNLPRFDAKKMLEKLRNKRLVFVGDSIGRNQWESLLCMLSTVVKNKSLIYEVNGFPITKHMGFLVFKFAEYNCTVEYYRAPFLVVQGRAPPGVPKNVKFTLKLDVLEWTSHKWKGADVLVFNTGHWWNYEKTIRTGCYFQEGNEVKMEMSVHSAYKRSLQTLFEWIHREVNRNKTQVIFRTYAPVHFRGGDWKMGGTCHSETLPDLGSSGPSPKSWALMVEPFKPLTLNDSSTSQFLELDVLDVTQMTARRKDAHSSLYYFSSGPVSLHRQDCSHWCLPGVPDTWNELLYALFLRRIDQNNIMGNTRIKLKPQ